MRAMTLLMFALIGAPATQAADLPPVVALSPAERAAILDGTHDDSLPLNGNPRQIHGEVGMEIGSRGTRALYGTTVVPLGQTGSASFSFLTAQSNGWRAR